MKKLIALVLALAMVLMVGAAFASTQTPATLSSADNASITVTLPTIPAGATANNTYHIYKVFDATVSGTNISYTPVSGKESTALPTGFTLVNGYVTHAAAEELTAEEIASIRSYVTNTDLVATVTTTASDTSFTVTGLDYGYYFIDTTVGTLVTINSTKPNATVNDKNTVPGVDKTITGATSVDTDGKKALAQVGTTVNYQAVITIGTGAINYVFHDTMETGLTYNGDAAVTGVAPTTGEGAETKTNYTVGQTGSDTFTITFDNDYIKTLAVGSTLTVTYSATVNDNAITTDPLNNTAYVSYGDSNGTNRTPDTGADVYEAKFTVHKNQPANQGDEGAVLNDSDNKYYKPLSGAGFVIKNASNKYYKLTTTTTGEGASAVTTNVVTWVDAIADATEYTSDSNGDVPAFTGLANGTYTLVEKTVPAGYNKADDQSFTINEHSYTAANLEQEATVTNNAGTQLPSTGGIGTTIFYIVGGLLVVGAAVVMVARRKASN